MTTPSSTPQPTFKAEFTFDRFAPPARGGERGAAMVHTDLGIVSLSAADFRKRSDTLLCMEPDQARQLAYALLSAADAARGWKPAPLQEAERSG